MRKIKTRLLNRFYEKLLRKLEKYLAKKLDESKLSEATKNDIDAIIAGTYDKGGIK